MNVTATIVPVASETALYMKYRGQVHRTYLEVNLEDGQITCGYNTEPGDSNTAPQAVRDGRWRRYDIPCITGTAANLLMTEVQPIAQRIINGAEIVLDDTDRLGALSTEDAIAAEDELVQLIAEYGDLPGIAEIGAAEWFSDEPADVPANTTDDELTALVAATEKEIGEAPEMGGEPAGTVIVPTGVEEYLKGRREEAREAAEEKLTEVAAELAEAREERDDLLLFLRLGLGVSLAQLGYAAGLSAPGVKRIVDDADEDVVAQFTAAPPADAVEVDQTSLRDEKLTRLIHAGTRVRVKTKQRDALIVEMRAWNDPARTDRRIGELADLSHGQVQNIAARGASLAALERSGS